jgi:hypothetical protein
MMYIIYYKTKAIKKIHILMQIYKKEFNNK